MTTLTTPLATRGTGLWSPPANPLPPTLGPRVCRWIERFLVFGEGDFIGEPFRLEHWQRALIYRLHEYDPVTLRRVVRRLLLVLPKGNGKTELVAELCLAELAGPVVATSDGRGGLRKSPNIPVAAATGPASSARHSAATSSVLP